MQNPSIKFYHRKNKTIEDEKVFGDKWISWIYETNLGLKLSQVLNRPFLSKIYGGYQNSLVSRHRIPSFVEAFNIDMSEYQGGNRSAFTLLDSYDSFNDFFIRKFNFLVVFLMYN